MYQAPGTRKRMSIGEGGSALAFAVLAFLALLIAAKAHTAEYAFHAYLFAAAAVAAVFAVGRLYMDRPAEPCRRSRSTASRTTTWARSNSPPWRPWSGASPAS